MNRLRLTGIMLIVLSCLFYGQPRLKIMPSQIKFSDVFNRLQNVYLINDGDKPLTVDSIYYRRNLFYMRYNRPDRYHITLNPTDTLRMDCILSNYFMVTSADTSDTMYVYSTPKSDNSEIKIKINFFNDNPGYGTIAGQITDSLYPLSNASVYFFYAGKYLLDSVITDNKGFYKKILPEGKYFVAAKKQGYSLIYYNDQPDPFQANSFYLDRNLEKTVNIGLHPELKTGYSIKGRILDPGGPFGLSKSIAVVRSGTHNPDGGGTVNKKSYLQNDIYTAIVDEDGTYSINNISLPGYYYVQGFSEYYLPGYFNSSNIISVFWQRADSIYINSELSGKDIYLQRDSSYGAGSISGSISVSSSTAGKLSDVVVLVKSLAGNFFYTYTYASSDGSYSVTDLPYGTYQVIAQKIGYDDAQSGTVKIDTRNTAIQGINLIFNSATGSQGLLQQVQLFPNYPNPFNPVTNIEFFLPSAENVTVDVLNILGEKVAELYSGFSTNGLHKFVFNGSRLSSGAYFVRLITSKGVLTRKVMLIK